MADTSLFRHEYKHLIHAADAVILRQRLSVVASRDRNAGADGVYLVRSLYFDNFDNKALLEKIDGVNHREKFRIRMYNCDPSFIHLEKKSKHNGLCCKESCTISREACARLMKGDYEWMKNPDEPMLVHELSAKMRDQMLRPQTVVEYLREPYVYPAGNVRITIDSRIRSGGRSTDFLSPQLTMIQPSDAMLLEVKYDAFLPSVIRDLLQLGDTHITAFSKYAVCRTVE